MGLMDSIRAKLELHRLEQKYARRDKRTTFYSNAHYVDGEYHFGDYKEQPVSKHSTGRSKITSVVKVTEILGKRSSRAY